MEFRGAVGYDYVCVGGDFGRPEVLGAGVLEGGDSVLGGLGVSVDCEGFFGGGRCRSGRSGSRSREI